MKRISIIPAAAIALLAACSDPGAMTSERSLTGPQFNHGPSHSLHGLATPATPTASAIGADVHLSWATTIADLQADCNANALANTEHPDVTCNEVHFEVYRDGAKLVDVKTTNAYVDAGLEPGTYRYWIKSKGMEGQGGGRPFTHHSLESEAVEVVVGDDVYTVVFLTVPGNAKITNDVEGNTSAINELNANAATWGDLTFLIRRNGVAITTCPVAGSPEVYAVTTFAFNGSQTADVTSTPDECLNGVYTMDIANKAKITGRNGGDYPSEGNITVYYDGAPVLNLVNYASSLRSNN